EERMMTGEGKTMPDIEVPIAQADCIKKAKNAGKKVVAVFFAGRPLGLNEIMPYCDAVLWAWHGGTMCGIAAADILFGDFNLKNTVPILARNKECLIRWVVCNAV
ncbi:MAG: glycoside hydrolase family 3 C-terminal domain-containing protein, partial [Alistipes sp.]|nr:glycoside hydrolase family 3 C-terminal domain-containing protein [Alistipes sp.]